MNAFRARFQALAPDIRLLLAIFAVLVPLRIVHTSHIRWLGVDGGFYAEVARHVRDGQGLSTHESLYHAGMEYFPHPSSIYPLWPLLLGYAARLADLEWLSHWLPLGLSFCALGAAFAFGRRLWSAPLIPTLIPAFHAGHLLVLQLGLQRDFLTFSSVPYTEPLSWTLLLLFLWRALGATAGWRWALEMGVWASLVYFCRAQLIIVPIAAVMASGLRVLTGPDRLRALGRTALTTGVIAVALGAWFLRIRTFVHDAGLGSLLRFDQNRATDLLAPFDVIVDTHGPWEIFLDRLSGLGYGWDPLSKSSYQAVFYASHWALPVALPFLIVAGVAAWRRQGLSGAWAALRRPEATGWALALLVAAGGLASVQLAHKHFNGSWYFDVRQSMICVLAFYLPLLWLLTQKRRAPALLGAAIFGTSALMGGRALLEQVFTDKGELRDVDRHGDLVNWLKLQSQDGPIEVAMQAGPIQRIGWRTSRVGYHWVYEETSYADLLKETDVLGAQWLIFQDYKTKAWRFRREGQGVLDHDFELLAERPDGYFIYKRRAAPPPPLESNPKVLVVGVDGASWKVMAPMIERGELPTFERLRVEGASQVDFATLEVTDSPVIWTTVATGRAPEDHGVTDYTQTLPGVGKVPITSDARKVPALWNLSTNANRSVSVINWWASWPAEPVSGHVVSDHANPAAAGWMKGKYWKADATALAAMHKDTWPEDLADTLAPLWLNPAAFPLDDLIRRAALSPAQAEQVAAAPFNERTTYSWLKTFYAVDEPHVRIAIQEMQTAQPDLLMVYLRGPDPVQHYAWDTVEPERYARQPEHLDRDRGVVQGVYRYVDSFLAEILASAAPDTLVIVLSDHGAEPADNAKKKNRTGRPGAHTKAAKGVLFLTGPQIRRGYDIRDAGPLDIAPTIAWALGLPVADDLPGRVLSDAFTLEFRERRDRQRVPSWGTREGSIDPTASPADANMLEQLRGLGYIQ